jgi:hypothetical protein
MQWPANQKAVGVRQRKNPQKRLLQNLLRRLKRNSKRMFFMTLGRDDIRHPFFFICHNAHRMSITIQGRRHITRCGNP